MSEPVAVRILDKEYLVACPEDERSGLVAAARLLDERLRAMRQTQKLAPVERLAVLVALNLAHEKLQLEGSRQSNDHGLERGLGQCELRLEQLLDTLAPTA